MTGHAPAQGVFISFEGVDGVGKTTQLQRLSRTLDRLGHRVVVTREPGATPLGAALRELLLDPERAISDRTEALLYAADRADHVDTVIRPALHQGSVVLTDRYIDSSVAYQGAGRGLGAAVRRLSTWATDGLIPQVTILLDADPAALAERLRAARGTLDRMESERLDFHRRVRAEFLSLARDEPTRFVVLDALADEETLARQIYSAVDPYLPGVSPSAGEGLGKLPL